MAPCKVVVPAWLLRLQCRMRCYRSRHSRAWTLAPALRGTWPFHTAIQLADALPSLNKLRALSLSLKLEDPTSADPVATSVASLSALHSLAIETPTNSAEESIEPLAAALAAALWPRLANLAALTALVLDVSASQESGRALGGQLPSLQHLQRCELLGAMRTWQQGTVEDVLAGAAASSTMTHLSLTWSKVSANALAAQVTALASLRSLHVPDMVLAPTSVNNNSSALLRMASSLQQLTALQRLQLGTGEGCYKLASSSIRLLSESLAVLSCLSQLILPALCTEDVRTIAAGLKALSRLVELDISVDNITDAGLQALCPALAQQRGLKELVLTNCNEQREASCVQGAAALGAALAGLRGLRRLWVLGAPLGLAGVRALAASVAQLPALRDVDFTGSGISGECKRLLQHEFYPSAWAAAPGAQPFGDSDSDWESEMALEEQLAGSSERESDGSDAF
jgi:hypothetical protein